MLDQMRNKLRMRLVALWILEAVAWIMVVLDRTALGGMIPADVLGMHTGFASGMSVAGLVFILQLVRTIRSDEKVKEWNREENDERNIAIRAKAGMPMMFFAGAGMIFAGLIAGYVSEVVMKTLWVAGIVQLLAGLAAKTYYSRTM